ncbi:MAG: hypothetical protein R3C18_22835 [Planctomycetaceae bacterium]
MGLEFKLETYDHLLTDIPSFITAIPEFLSSERGQWHLSIDGETVAVTVRQDDENLFLTQHVACRETDALLGLLIRRLLSQNDNVVVSEV